MADEAKNNVPEGMQQSPQAEMSTSAPINQPQPGRSRNNFKRKLPFVVALLISILSLIISFYNPQTNVSKTTPNVLHSRTTIPVSPANVALISSSQLSAVFGGSWTVNNTMDSRFIAIFDSIDSGNSSALVSSRAMSSGSNSSFVGVLHFDNSTYSEGIFNGYSLNDGYNLTNSSSYVYDNGTYLFDNGTFYQQGTFTVANSSRTVNFITIGYQPHLDFNNCNDTHDFTIAKYGSYIMAIYSNYCYNPAASAINIPGRVMFTAPTSALAFQLSDMDINTTSLTFTKPS